MNNYKVLLGLVALLVVGGIAVYSGQSNVTEYERQITATSTVESAEAVEPADPLDEAQEALDRANKLLDEEEARLLEQRAVIDARLEEIVKKRSAF